MGFGELLGFQASSVAVTFFVISLATSYACWRMMAHSKNAIGPGSIMKVMGEQLRDSQKVCHSQLVALVHFGIFLDHAGVDLERGPFADKGEELKLLGAALRRLNSCASPLDISMFHNEITDMCRKYAVDTKGSLAVHHIPMLAECIFYSMTVHRQAAQAPGFRHGDSSRR